MSAFGFDAAFVNRGARAPRSTSPNFFCMLLGCHTCLDVPGIASRYTPRNSSREVELATMFVMNVIVEMRVEPSGVGTTDVLKEDEIRIVTTLLIPHAVQECNVVVADVHTKNGGIPV